MCILHLYCAQCPCAHQEAEERHSYHKNMPGHMQELQCILMDYDPMDPDDEIGRCTIRLADLVRFCKPIDRQGCARMQGLTYCVLCAGERGCGYGVGHVAPGGPVDGCRERSTSEGGCSPVHYCCCINSLLKCCQWSFFLTAFERDAWCHSPTAACT